MLCKCYVNAMYMLGKCYVNAIRVYCLAAVIGLAACNPVEPTNPTDNTNIVDQMPKSAKRGVAFSFTQVTDLPLMSPYISWDYNWGNAPTDNAAMWFDAVSEYLDKILGE